MRKQTTSDSSLENSVGYSRAIKVGNTIEVAGTAALDGDNVVGANVYEQSIFIFNKIEAALIALGATMADVVRTRMFITDISDWEAAGKAHGEFFKDIKPVTTMVEVSRLIHPDMLIEIEATAVID